MNKSKVWSLWAIIVFLLSFVPAGRAQLPAPPDPFYQLNAWYFLAPDWLSTAGDGPLSFTNVNNPPSFDGNALQVDSTNAAWMEYPIEDAYATNLNFKVGSVECWVLPDWNSGTGPGDWGRLIDVGAYSTNSASSWWSLYFSPDGTRLDFSSETNGVFTNYLSVPIAWATNNWNYVCLTYNHFWSDLYTNGVLAATGPGVYYTPSAEAFTNGFFVGSDWTGTRQSRALIDDLATYNYSLSEYEVSNDYAAGYQLLASSSGFPTTDSSGGPMPPGYSGGGGTNDVEPRGEDYSFTPGTNLWLAMLGISNNVTSVLLSNTVPDILYELQGCTNLVAGGWFSVGFVYGSELTNCVPVWAPASQQGNLFLRIRSWADDTGTGIPDWWWLSFYGQITNVDAYADPEDDNYDDLQKFQMGLNPLLYYNPNPPGGFFGALDATGTNVFLEWTNAPGPVLNYAIERGVLNTNGQYTYSQVGVISSNANYFEDAGAISNSNAWNNVYTLAAVYPGGSFSATDTWQISLYVDNYLGNGNYTAPNGPPAPVNVDAYLDATGTNVLLSWTPVQSQTTGYIIYHGVYNYTNSVYVYSSVGEVSSNATSFEAVGLMTNVDNWSDDYEVAATYPGGITSVPISSYSDVLQGSIGLGSATGPTAPGNFYGYTDATGTNVILNWTASPGAVTNYLVWGGNYDWTEGNYVYQLLGRTAATTNVFEAVGAVDGSGDNLYNLYAVAALYPGGDLSQAAWWYSYDGAPAPGALYAYVDSTGTNIMLAWSPANGAVTNYVIQKSGNSGETFGLLAQASGSTTWYEDTNGAAAGVSSIVYELQAAYPNGGLSSPVTATVSSNPPAPSNLAATVDSTGTNVDLSWTAAAGNAANYIIKRGILNTNTGVYTYSQIGEVSGGVSSFEDAGGIANPDSYQDQYQVEAVFPGGILSQFSSSGLANPYEGTPYNLRVSAQLVRGPTGRYQLVFSYIPPEVQYIQLLWSEYNPMVDEFSGNFRTDTVPTNDIINGCYTLPDYEVTNLFSQDLLEFNDTAYYVSVQAVSTNGAFGAFGSGGFIPNDAPYFVDGREHLKQNLLFEIRAATMEHACPVADEAGYYDIPLDTNYVECSLFHWAVQSKLYGNSAPNFIKESAVWPFVENYQFHQRLFDTNNPGVSFTWSNNMLTVAAPAVLGIGDPYWISQGFGDLADVAAYTNSGNFYLESGQKNLFGLSFQAALVDDGAEETEFLGQYLFPIGHGTSVTTLDPGSSMNVSNVTVFFNQTADPVLQTNGYYFSIVNTPGTTLTGDASEALDQPAPMPAIVGFAHTNQTGLMIASVGSPTVVGCWEKYSVSNSSPTKYAYLGQYFITNAFVLTNGVVTTNTTGIVSPYGDFFPMQPGQAAIVTMPDIDTGQQATGAVDVISMNVDANHDGTMDFTYSGPDQTSTSRPFRFWVNDDTDWSDDKGDGIPGQGAQADGVLQTQVPVAVPFQSVIVTVNNGWNVHGRRDLVDFFPVYLNIGSLFQSNALSAGISTTDTNYQFVLSQAEGALRFAYTDLTPTNYMNFLRDTNESSSLAFAALTTISNTGVVLPPSFIGGIAASNQGIILVEAWTNTTQPLMLTVYHGTNQIAQTSLYLSISEVEQMFRSKSILLYPDQRAVPDRLTDAQVPNEPDTTGVNFIFVHGYNVNPDQARGWNSDIYKRLYWSGSHARFYGVTWTASDSQVAGQVSINLQTNIVHAFATAPLLNTFLNSLSGTNVVAGHSLGNMLTLITLNDCSNQNINTYCMIDAAVAIEAIDTSATLNPDMYPTAWTNYESHLWAADWHNLFLTSDGRSHLTWSGRLANLQNASVYNFYSSGEEVLRDYPTDPPTNYLGIVKSQLVALWEGDSGVDAWAFQEKLKGLMLGNGFLSSDHGGWQMNEAYETNVANGYGSSYWEPMSQGAASALTTNQLQTNAFFNVSSGAQYADPFTNDLALESSSGSSYAQTNQNRILSDAIPCLTLPVGANPVPKLDSFGRNFDMQTLYENGWPLDRGKAQWPVDTTAYGEWHHSDVRAVAYTFTYQLFDQMVTFGKLK